MDFKIELPQLVNEALSPLMQSVGNTLQSVWDLVFGQIDLARDKMLAKHYYELSEFKKALELEIGNIPLNQLREPPLSIVGPALESAKYHFEAPELRKMFASLIASSMDSNRCDKVHPSFAEILRQMDSYDAHNFSLFSNLSLPTAQYRAVYQSKLSEIFIYDFLADGVPINNPERMGASISHLVRLGLIEISRSIVGSKDHAQFYSNQFFTDQTRKLSSIPGFLHLDVICGFAALTPVGKLMYETCINAD